LKFGTFLIGATILLIIIIVGVSYRTGSIAEDLHMSGVKKRKAGDLDGAIADFDKAIRMIPTIWQFYSDRAVARSAKGDRDGAIADYSRVINLSPKEPFAYANRGLEREGKGDLAGAISDASYAISLDPNYAWGYYVRGDAKDLTGDTEGSIADLDKAIQYDPTARGFYCSRAITRSKMGDRDGAIADCSKAIELAPSSALAYDMRGDLRREGGDLEAAIADYDKAIELDPTDWSIHTSRARARWMERDLERGLADCNLVIQRDPGNASAHSLRGYLEYDQHAWREALDDFRKACELEHSGPPREYVRLRIWLIRSRLGEREDATKELAQYLSSRPQNDWYSKNAKFLVGQLSESEYFQAAQSTIPKTQTEQSCEAWFYAGTVRLLDGDRKTAAAYFQKCLDTGVKRFTESMSAEAELKALGK